MSKFKINDRAKLTLRNGEKISVKIVNHGENKDRILDTQVKIKALESSKDHEIEKGEKSWVEESNLETYT